MLPSVSRNVDELIQVGPWTQAGPRIQVGGWRNCTNRGRGLLFEEIRCQTLTCNSQPYIRPPGAVPIATTTNPGRATNRRIGVDLKQTILYTNSSCCYLPSESICSSCSPKIGCHPWQHPFRPPISAMSSLN